MTDPKRRRKPVLTSSKESAARFLECYERRTRSALVVHIGGGEELTTPEDWKQLERVFPGVYGDWIVYVSLPTKDYTFKIVGQPQYLIAVSRKSWRDGFAYRNSTWEILELSTNFFVNRKTK